MPQSIETTIKNLGTLENNSARERYIGDATEYAFRRHTLELLKGLRTVNINQLLKQNKFLQRRIEKLERNLDYYIKEYPEQLKELEKKKEVKPNSSHE